MMKIDLIKCLRIGTVPRWTIIPMTRTQTVAEHSYNVWLITTVLYDILYPLPHNSPEKALVLEYALVHDLAETMTGDMPTPAKKMIEDTAPGLLDRIEENALHRIYPRIVSVIRGAQNTPGEAIVKLADKMEALVYATKFAADGGEAAVDVKRGLWKHLAHCERAFPQVQWAKAINYLYEIFPDLLGPDPMD